MKDPYQILGVARGASHDEIKKAYRKLAKELHPDRHPGNAKIGERFKEVSAAYHIVGDETLRARFDRGEIDAGGAERAPGGAGRAYAHAGGNARGPQGFQGFAAGEAEDLFAELFGNFRRGASRAGAGAGGGARGGDQHFSLKITFLEAAQGATRRLSLPSGKTLDVKIPAGVEEGQQIRLKAQGEPGMGSGAAGDALIEVQIEPHAFFVRKGQDIHLELPVTVPEAVQGARITVPTIDGMVALTVPKNSNSGSVLRLKGKGIHAARSGAGDQYVKLKVVLPETPDPALERFIASWKPAVPYNVRARFTLD